MAEPTLNNPATWAEDQKALVKAEPRQDVRKLMSQSNGFGYEAGYDEARAEILFRVREVIDRGDDPRAYIENRLQKLRDYGRMPSGFDRDGGG